MRTGGQWVLILSAVLLAAPAWAKGKAKPRSKPDVVALRFGWPAGMTADVAYRWTRTKKGKPPQSSSLTARLTVAVEGETLRVGYRDWKSEAIGNGQPAGAGLPSFEDMAAIVDKAGALVRVDGAVSPGDARRIAAGTPGATKVGAAVTKQVAELVPALMRQQTERTWQMLVGSWVGADLEIGSDYETEEEGPVPLVPGGKLKTNLHIRAERRLECPGHPGKRCVELRLRSEPDRESMAKLVEALGAKFGTKDLGSFDMSAVEEFTLVTEPGRLIPHRLDITKSVSLNDGSGISQLDRTTWTFQYPAATSQPPSSK